ncbi:hypothetical protein AMAG_20290, partial [Allomyces macrogynus ATCC 38327]
MFDMKQAILAKNFDKFAETTMNDVSRAIIQLVTDFNATPVVGYEGKYKVAYTYDAGPNA